MGDRGNIVVKQAAGKFVYLYTHWTGSQVQEITRRALARKVRWDDPAYLTRIIFDELCPTRGGETGFGISLGLCDNQHPIVVVDCVKQEVRIMPEGKQEEDGKGISFDKFIKNVLKKKKKLVPVES
jgi:hypothetical protein